jgi:hypothetical protein
MLRRLLWITGIAAAVAYVLRRRRLVAEPAGAGPAPDPAEELRRKLDQVRNRDEPATELSDAPAEDLDTRRRDVHDRARAAADEMRGSTPD